MCHLSSFCVFGLLISALLMLKVSAGPLVGRKDLDPELISGNFEGDMILVEHQIRALHTKLQGRNGLVAASKRWPNNNVIYKITGSFDIAHRQAILEAIALIEARSCVRFLEANDSTPHYVQITSEPGGCYTAVGYLAKVQQMNLEIYPLNEGCFRTGSILHELMHVLGFYHQQSDTQRDEYVEILYDNILPGKEFNFEKYKSTIVTDFDVGYDYESCLHFGPKAFSSNGRETIRPLDPNAKIGQRVTLSQKDIAKINIMYKCPIFI